MHTGAERIDLPVGFVESRGTRITVAVMLGLLLAGTCGCLSGMVVVAARSGGDFPFALAAAVGVLVVAGMGLWIAFVARAGAWLEGTLLSVRTLGTRTVDLASARSIRLESVAEPGGGAFSTGPMGRTAHRTPILVVVGGDTTVRLRLRSRDGGLLPGAYMTALADVLSATDRPGGAEAAHWCRSIATDPRSLLD